MKKILDILMGNGDIDILIKKDGEFVYGFTWDSDRDEGNGKFRGEWTRRSVGEKELTSGEFFDNVLPNMEHYCDEFRSNIFAVFHIVGENVKGPVDEEEVLKRVSATKLTIPKAYELLKDKEDGEFVVFVLDNGEEEPLMCKCGSCGEISSEGMWTFEYNGSIHSELVKTGDDGMNYDLQPLINKYGEKASYAIMSCGDSSCPKCRSKNYYPITKEGAKI